MNETRQEKTIPIIAFIIIQILFIVIVISLVAIFSKSDEISDADYERQPSITIENLTSELPNAATGYVDLIERGVVDTIELNTGSFSLSDAKAEIRPGTLKIQQFDGMEGYYFSAIIDIPNLQQSYQLYDQYPTDDSPPNSTPSNMRYVLCLDVPSEIIYPDFDCKDIYDTDPRPRIAANYLKYFDFAGFTASVDAETKTVFINLADSSASPVTQEIYVDQVKDALSQLGISPKIFTFKVTKLEEVNYESYIVEN